MENRAPEKRWTTTTTQPKKKNQTIRNICVKGERSCTLKKNTANTKTNRISKGKAFKGKAMRFFSGIRNASNGKQLLVYDFREKFCNSTVWQLLLLREFVFCRDKVLDVNIDALSQTHTQHSTIDSHEIVHKGTQTHKKAFYYYYFNHFSWYIGAWDSLTEKFSLDDWNKTDLRTVDFRSKVIWFKSFPKKNIFL